MDWRRSYLPIFLVLPFATATEAQPYTAWGKYRTVTLNTTASGGGANVSGTVTDFPALIRLTDANADDILDEALSGGADVRFASSDGLTALSYEIERWTSTAAEIWVLVPSVAGNSTTDIRIYWKKSGESDASNAANVFQTSNNFSAVWHLDEDGNTTAGGYADATSNNYDGTGVSMTASSDVAAAVGIGQDFDGAADYMTTTASTNSGTRTLSAWIYPNTSDDVTYIESLIDGDVAGQYGQGLGLDNGVFKILLDNEFWTTTQAVTLNAWQHVALTINSTTAKLYLNGDSVASYSYTQGSVTNTTYQIAKSKPNAYFFDGVVDEMRVMEGVSGKDWIKLSHQTQMPGATCVTLGPAVSTTYYWNRSAVMTSSTDFNKAYNWTSNADATGRRPPSSDDDDFTSGTLGADWTCLDADNNAGTGTCDATTNDNRLTISGRGADVWGSVNEFTALHRADLTGSFDVSMKVASSSGADSLSKAGIMVADDVTALGSGGFLILAVRQNGVVVWERDEATTVGQLDASSQSSAQTFPVYLRLVKNGTAFSGFYRTALASAWTQIGSASTPQSTATDSKAALFYTAHSTTSTGTAVFDEFQGGTNISATDLNLSGNGTGAAADANATLSADLAAASIDFTGYSGTFNFNTNAFTINSGNATFVSTQTVTAGTGTLAFTANSGTQTFTPKSGATFPAVTKSGASGTVAVATNALTADAFTLTSGTWQWGSGMTHSVTSISTAAGAMDFGSSTVQVTSGNANLSSLGTLTAGTGTLAFTGTSGTQVFTPDAGSGHPHITHAAASTLQLSTNALSCLSFTQSAGVLDFNSVNITTTSSGNFTVSNGTTASFSNLNGRTLTVAGNASFTGQSGNLLNLNAAAWTLTVTGALTASYANIAGSNAGGGSAGTATSSTDGGGNSNWNFPTPFSAASWNYTTQVSFNTTSTGANVSGNVNDFPMLIRLDSNNFYFAQAQSDGGDIRFLDPDDAELSYEIERWDASLKKAEIWVKVPQVDGNSQSDYITMHWGNPSATSASDGTAVFSTANSHTGVWHMDEEASGTGTADLYQDATGNNYDGDDYIGSTTQEGLIGKGHDFDGTDDRVPLVAGSSFIPNTSTNLTASAWVKADAISASTDGNRIFGIPLADSSSAFLIALGSTNRFELYTAALGANQLSNASLSTGLWTHVAATWDGTNFRMYVNGALDKTVAGSTTAGVAALARIGIRTTNQYKPFDGHIDEVCFSQTARSTNFIKLSYETQRTNNTAVVYANTALSTFAYSTKIYVNTTATGANVGGDVTSYPLLVRLTGGNFDFSQAKSDGGDVRFADSTGALLSYEIDRWDAANKLAEIWVLLSTVKGNNNSQWFKMHWGKSTATTLSSGSTVFQTTSSYVGVYHLQESSGSTTAEATYNAQTGTFNGNVPNQVTGDIAKAHSFDGNGDYVNVPTNAVWNMSSGDRVTMSAWVNRQGNAAAGSHEGIAGRYEWTGGNYREFILIHYNSSAGFQIRFSTDGTSANETTLSSNYQATNGTWYHVTGVLDGSYARIYVNGVERNKVAFSGNVYYSVNSPFRIGMMDDNGSTERQFFNGTIDQVQVSNAARPADVIKLNYETQKTGSTAVTVGWRTRDFTKSTRFNFNTTSTGANVSGNVANIPILVKLTSSAIDFSQTTAGGTDILFTDPDGTRLYHEVVEWDKANTLGKVWVKVPQVDGNSTTDYIHLYYGCSSCTSNPQAVTDSVWSSYTGVFHLNAPETRAEDAAALGNDGVYYKNQANVAGLTTKNAAYFDGVSDYVDVPNESNYDYATNVTVSAWVKVTAFPSSGSAIAGKGNTAWRLNRNAATNNVEFVCTKTGTDYAAVGTASVNDGGWHYVAGTYDGSNVKMYVDGAQSGSSTALTGSLDNIAAKVFLGENSGSAGKYWNGALGEVRLSGSSAVQSADFIKLSYENQRASNTLFSTPITTASFTGSKAYKFNTTASGANISGDVYNFPLLLRITGSTICDAVQSGAPDIRFLDADGVTWLDYQVERWNTTVDSAEVWVKVPKIDGNGAGDYITLYYNDVTNGSVPDGQCATCVFDGAGIKAAWHMNDNAASATVAEARGAYNGTLKRSGANRNTNLNVGDGYIGASSLTFNGADEQVDLGNGSDIVQNAEGITMSAWVKASALGTNKRNVMFFENNGGSGSRAKLYVTSNSFVGGGGRSADGESLVEDTTTGGALSTATWVHLATVLDYKTDTVRAFINGTRYATTRGTNRFGERLTSNTTSNRNTIGSHADATTEEWNGNIDEAQLSVALLDSNWIKLSYQSQRRDATPLFNPSPTDFSATRKYIFNTTETGANIADSVTNYPLLVRITGSTIVDAVQNDYDDIRFLDGDGKTWLNYQVERWDKIADSAEVWVLVPQVDGNSDHDFITLYYNDVTDGSVADGQCASCVFSTGNNFTAVWHLSEETAGTGNANLYQDATSNDYDGDDYIASTTRQGVAGPGHDFSPASTPDDYIDLVASSSLIPSASTHLTYSAWFKADAISATNGVENRILSVGRDATSASAVSFGLGNTNDVMFFTYGTNTTYNSTGNVSTGIWTHAALTFDGANFKLYIDGSLDLTQAATSYAGGSYVAKMGAQDGASLRAFDGHLDEVRVSQTARSADFIKLDYETQRWSGNKFWNSRPGPDNVATLTATANAASISLSWSSTVSDSSNADSVGIWVKYSAYPDSVGATATTFVVKLPIAESTYTYPATYPATYYFSLAVHNTAGNWSPFTQAASDTAVLGGPGASHPDTVYVDSAIGSDGNSCASARHPSTPKLTIASAVTNCTAVDTLVVRVLPGTYTSNSFTMNTDPTVIQSFDGRSRAVLNGAGSVAENSSTFYYTVALNTSTLLRNMDVKTGANTYHGVYVRHNATGVVVDGCRIYNASGSVKHDVGIRIASTGNTSILLANNLIHQPTSYGVQMANDQLVNIVHNLFYGSGGSTKGIYYPKSAGTADYTLANNIFYNWDYGIHTTDSDNEIGLVANNLFWLVTTGREVSGETDAAKIVKDPLLVSTTLLDYNFGRVYPTSPSLDAGTSSLASGAYNRNAWSDLYGTTRPSGSARDIGLYEGSGYSPSLSGDFDTLITATTATTVTVKNSQWKVVFDIARGGGIRYFYDMDDSAANLVSADSLLFNVIVNSTNAARETGNTIAPELVRKCRAFATVKQRLAISASLDLEVYYTLHASGHIYAESRLVNLAAGSTAITTLDFTARVGTATSASGNGGATTGFGYLTTSTRDAAFMATLPLDTGASTAETWTQTTASGANGYVKMATAELADLAQNFIRTHAFLLYIGDAAITYSSTAALYAEASNPLPLRIHAGSPLHERSWQDALWGHWNFDDAGGTTARDKSVYFQHNGAITGGTWISGKVGGALRLATTDVVAVSDNDSLEAFYYWTVCFWVNPDFTNMGTTAYFLSKGTSASDGWFIRKVSGQNQITFNMGAGSVTVTLNNSAWNHVTFAVDSRRQIHAYVNGVRVAAGTTGAAAVANSSGLRFGENAGGGAVDRFKGDLDDIRIFRRELDPEEIQALVRQGFGRLDGLYRLRADNNNRVDLTLNDTALQTHVRPTFYIDNWFAGRTPNYVFLDGARLTPLVDFVSDTLIHNYPTSGAKLVLQLNRIITASKADLFIDDDDSSGYLGASSAMPSLVTTYDATAHTVKVRNFADTVFGSHGDDQWEVTVDLSGSTATTDGDGGIHSWKSSEVSPGLALSSAADLTGSGQYTLDLMRLDNSGATEYTSGSHYTSPVTTTTYTLLDSSSTRLKIRVNAVAINEGTPDVTLERTFTFYPTGKIFVSHKWTSLSANAAGTGVLIANFTGMDADVATVGWNAASGKTGKIGGDGDHDFHSLGLAMLSVKPGSSSAVMGGGTVASTDNSSTQMGLTLNGYYTTANVGAGGVYTNYVVDIAKDYADSAGLDTALAGEMTSSQLLTAITGSLVTNDAQDFNADGYAEGEGAYTYAASSGGIAHFRFDASTPRANPAFKITSWTFGTLPDYVFVDNQSQVIGYHYNAALDNTNNAVILQFNKTLSGGTHAIYISQKNGLAVALNEFGATGEPGGVALHWITESEFENLGYHLWRRSVPRPKATNATPPLGGAGGAGGGDTLRSPTEQGFTPGDLAAAGFARVAPILIPGAPDGRSGSTRSYSFLDRAAVPGSAHAYLLEAVDFQGRSSFFGPVSATPGGEGATALFGNYPNPFNPVTFIRFALRDATAVSLVIYDANGRAVKTLIRPEKPLPAGRYSITWDATDNTGRAMATGPYFYRFRAGKYLQTKKMILLK